MTCSMKLIDSSNNDTDQVLGLKINTEKDIKLINKDDPDNQLIGTQNKMPDKE